MKKIIKSLPYAAFLLSLLSMLGSLYFSEILKFTPCVLCWYQRICMYPVVVITAIGIIRKDKGFMFFVLPLSSIGFFIALYHNLLYYHILPESIAPCVNGVSCTTKLIEWFGFITIPLMSMISFALISLCMILYKKYQNVYDK